MNDRTNEKESQMKPNESNNESNTNPVMNNIDNNNAFYLAIFFSWDSALIRCKPEDRKLAKTLVAAQTYRRPKAGQLFKFVLPFLRGVLLAS